jgi:hypothetical protein
MDRARDGEGGMKTFHDGKVTLHAGDPFAGAGTTGAASFIEGCQCVLIEREAEYLADIEKRMGMLLSGPEERSWKLAKPEPLEALPLFSLTEPAA